MRVMTRYRGEGKTTELVRWAARHENRVILTINSQRADAILDKHGPLFGSTDAEQRRRVMPISTARTALRGRRQVVLGVDDLDEVLSDLLGHPLQVGFVTITGDEV